MGKKNAALDAMRLNRLDNRLYYFIAISIFLITFIVRLKKLSFYYSYDLQNPLRTVFNTFTYYKLIGLVVLFLVAIGIFIYRSVKYHVKLKLDTVTIGILLIIISSIISTLFTDLTKEAVWGFYTRNNGLLAYISLFGILFIVSQLKIEDKHLRLLSHCVNIISVLLVAIGIFEFFGHYLLQQNWYKNFYIPAEMRGAIEMSVRSEPFTASGILSQPNYFGAYCSIIFPFITIQAIDAKKWIDKILFSIGSVILFVGTYISASIGPWVVVLVVLTLMIFTYKHWKSYIHISVLLLLYSLITSIFIGYHLKYIPWIIKQFLDTVIAVFIRFNYKFAFLLLPVILLFVLYYKYQKINKFRLISIIIIISILFSIIGFVFVLENVVPNNMDMLSTRGYVWHYTYQMLKENFIIGYGPDTFYYGFPQNNPDAMTYSKNIVFDKPHNMYLQMFVDNGLLGIVGFIILLTSALLLLLRSTYRVNGMAKSTFSKATLFTTIAYMIQGITNDNHMVIQPILYLLIATGIAVSREQNIV